MWKIVPDWRYLPIIRDSDLEKELIKEPLKYAIRIETVLATDRFQSDGYERNVFMLCSCGNENSGGLWAGSLLLTFVLSARGFIYCQKVRLAVSRDETIDRYGVKDTWVCFPKCCIIDNVDHSLRKGPVVSKQRGLNMEESFGTISPGTLEGRLNVLRAYHAIGIFSETIS